MKEVSSCSKTFTCANNFLSISHTYKSRFVKLNAILYQKPITTKYHWLHNLIEQFTSLKSELVSSKWNTSISFFEVTLRRNPWFSMNWKWKSSISLEVNLIGSIWMVNVQQLQNWKDKNRYTCKNLLGIASLDSSRVWELSFPNSLIWPSLHE